MDGIAQRFLQAGELRRDLSRGLPEDALGKPHVLGVRAVFVDAQDPVVLADVRVAGPALEATGAGDVRLGRDVIPNGDRRHAGTGLDDLAAQLMPDDARRADAALGPFVPAVDVVIGPAEGRGQNLHDHLPRAGRRFGNVQQLQPRGSLRLDQCAHATFLPVSYYSRRRGFSRTVPSCGASVGLIRRAPVVSSFPGMFVTLPPSR